MSLGLLMLFAMAVSVPGAGAADYKIKWINNMNYSEGIGNADGFCTGLKADLLGAQGQLLATQTYTGNLKVQDGYTMNLSTPPPPANSCVIMKLSGTCTYTYYRSPKKTESTSLSVACASGKAVFLVNAFGIIFYPGEQ